MDIVIVGHVDHGKSTIVGRLLADTGSLPEGKLEQVKANCERNSKPFEYAFLFDSLRDEQSQGITIDAARIFFKSKARTYIILDAPGHIEFLKNMVTGASRAEAALLVIDGKEGVKENSRRHGYMLSLLGVKQIAVLVNKMDLLKYEKGAFERICKEYQDFLREIKVDPLCFTPVAGILGENIVNRSELMSWYTGPTVLEALDSFVSAGSGTDLPFRMPVQGVYKFTKDGDDRRIVAGSITSGTIRVGDELAFYPSGKRSKVKFIESYNTPRIDFAQADSATGFTLTEQIYLGRGEIATIANQTPRPKVATKIRTSLFWLGKMPMFKKRRYTLKLGTEKTEVKLAEILRVMDTSNLNTVKDCEQIGTNAVAECVLELDKPIAVDIADEFANTGRFVILDRYDISGGGLVREVIETESAAAKRIANDLNSSLLSAGQRAERFGHKPCFLLLAGSKKSNFRNLAKKLELKLFNSKRTVYFLDPERISSDPLDSGYLETVQHFLDAGVLLITAFEDLSGYEIHNFKARIGSRMAVIAAENDRSCEPDAFVHGSENEMIDQIEAFLVTNKITLPGK